MLKSSPQKIEVTVPAFDIIQLVPTKEDLAAVDPWNFIETNGSYNVPLE